MKNSLSAIVMFAYARLEHTIATLEALSMNDGFKDHSVIIFSDGPKAGHEEKVEKLREYLREFKSRYSNVQLLERDKNMGLEKSIITGVTETLKKYPSVIVVEDDIKTSPKFLTYMESMLRKYEKDMKVGGISGYNAPVERMAVPKSYEYDIFFAPRTCSWGWATWRNRWDNVDWKVKDIESFIKDRKLQKEFNKGGDDLSRMLINQATKGIDTWDIQWCYHNFKKNRLTIYPTISYVENIGMDGTGAHCGKTSGFKNNSLNTKTDIKTPNKVEIDESVLRSFKRAQSLTLKMYAELIYDRGIKILKSLFK